MVVGIERGQCRRCQRRSMQEPHCFGAVAAAGPAPSLDSACPDKYTCHYTFNCNLEFAKMPQITLYLDDATQTLVEQAALAQGWSKSRWVAEVIRKYAAQEWPPTVKALAGQFADFPVIDNDGAATVPHDVARIEF